jgi:hypothetical protein
LSLEGPIFESNERISELSKRMDMGQMRRIGKPRFDICGSPTEPHTKTLKVRHHFSCRLRTNNECDSEIAKVLNGRLISSKLIHGLNLDGKGRGAYHGNLLIVGAKGTEVKGIISGITNAGTHHTPLKACEQCSVKGHMEGRLVGRITKGPLIDSRIFASYAMKFDPSDEFTDTTVKGELEGIIVSDCTH